MQNIKYSKKGGYNEKTKISSEYYRTTSVCIF